MTTTNESLFDMITHYCNIMFDRNLHSFGNYITKNDILHEVLAAGCTDEKQAVNQIRNVIFFWKRKLIAMRQNRQNKDITGDKVCGRCGPRPVSEFYTRIDSRTGFRYLCNLCKDCERQRHNENYRKKMLQKANADLKCA